MTAHWPHTPGPWQAGLSEINYQTVGAWYQASISLPHMPGRYLATIVADVRALGDETTIAEAHANARLIAAAPDLLAACAEARRLFACHCTYRGTDIERDWLAQVSAAIAKATAVQP